MYNPKISIITVVYNAVNTIEKTINSVVKQDYSNIEYVVVDGCSTDGTSEIIEKYKDFINVSICENDNGLYDAMNKGIKCTSGDIIGIINADDWYCSEKIISRVASTFEELGNATDIVSGQINFIRDDLIMGTTHYNNICSIWREMPVAHPATFVKKNIYESIGLFDTTFEIAADYDFLFRCYLDGRIIHYIEEPLVNYSVSGVSGTRKRKLFEEDSRILNKYAKYYNNPREIDDALIYKEKLLLFYECNHDVILEAIKQPIYIWGCGYWGREIATSILEKGVNIEGFVDNNLQIWGTHVQGIPVYSPTILKSGKCNVIIAVKGKELEIMKQVMALNKDTNAISMEDFFDSIWCIIKRVKF